MVQQFVADLEELADLGLIDDEATDEDDLLGSLCEEYVASLNHGEPVDRASLLAKCPESLCREASRLLDAIDLLREQGVGNRSLEGSEVPGGSVE